MTAPTSQPGRDQLDRHTPPAVEVTGTLIPGTTEAARLRAKDLRWLRKAEHWGEWIRFSDAGIAPPERAWMMRHVGSGRVRFYAIGEGQVGPEHKNMVMATYWAYANRWIDPECEIGFNLACRAEVLAGGIHQGYCPERVTR